ncbi:MAG TPA: hypothetical protein VEL80_08690 [Burkholderiales bacterium]|nr:hypothetical protein [Burkholderiales bacterium]
MIAKRSLLPFAPFALAAVLCGCTQKNTGDQPAAPNVPTGLERFLLFPNPIAQSSGGFETDTNAYADAYYSAIDPTNAKDTLVKWMTQNGFGSGTGAEYRAVFRDVRDLGYGRNMNGRLNTDGSIAFFVENYNVGYSSSVNVDVAIARDKTWHVGTNAIEWSASPCVPGVDPADCSSTVKFAKYFNFSSADGTRQLSVDLDGKGKKAMPGPCITCHGGRGDPLTPADASTGKPRFPLVENSLSRKRGDTQARLQGMNVDSFEFSKQAGWTRADQEATLKIFNQWILCTYPLAGAAAGAEDSCRVAAGQNEWQGTAAEMIKSWYGGPGMPIARFQDTYVPAGWSANPSLYTNVVAPFCRTCHSLRGTKNQDDLDFMTLAKFQGYADRIKSHVFDRGTMPLALIVYDDFWKSSAPDTLANFINPLIAPQTATTASGTALRPGRPVAGPGPNRMVRSATSAILSAEDSLFATTYNWSVVSGSATIINPNSMIATFSPSPAGSYTVRLTVSNGSATDSKDVTITVDDAFPDPSGLRFAHVKNVLQNIQHSGPTPTCVGCHKDVSTPAPTNTPPVWYTNFDRDGSGGAADATDDTWFLKGLTGRVNLTEIEASPLLRKPSGNHHSGGTLLNVADTTSGGGLSNYSILYNWILAGMQGGGVAANAGPNTISPPLTVTFNGVFPGPFTANIPLDGSKSVGLGTLSYLWTVASEPLGGFATFPGNSFTDNVPLTTLTVQNVGAYVVHLQVSDGPSTDIAQRTIVVDETPLAANVVVAGLSGGSVSVNFAGTPAAGSINVTANQTAGNPVTCLWQVNGAAPTPSATGVTVGPSSCSGATLNVLQPALGNTFSVSLTQQNVSQPPVVFSQTFTVQAAAGSNPSGADFNPITSTALGYTVSGNPANAPARTINSVTLQGTASGPGPLNFSWTTTAGSAGCSIPAGSSTSTTKLLSVTSVGTCSVTMTVSNGFPPNAVVTKTVTISSTVVFSQVAAILGNAGNPSPGSNAGCTGCHFSGGPAVPSWVDDGSLRTRLAGVINGTQSSLLLICPTFGSGAGGNAACTGMPFPQTGFGSGVFNNYDAFLTWILNGQP